MSSTRVDVERPEIAGRPSWDQVQYWKERGRRAADAAHAAATSDGTDPCAMCGLRVPGRRDGDGRCRHCQPGQGAAPQAPASATVARSARSASPPGAAALCRQCGFRLTACYPNQQYHPLCDPDPAGWTDAQLDEWTARAAARAEKETAT